MKLHLPVILFRVILGAWLPAAPLATAVTIDSSGTSLTVSSSSSQTIQGEGHVELRGSQGDGITNHGTLSMADNGDIAVSEHAGNGIWTTGSLDVSRNDTVMISGNSLAGLEIESWKQTLIADNQQVLITQNGSHGISDISEEGYASLVISGNAYLLVSSNGGTGISSYVLNSDPFVGWYYSGNTLSIQDNENITIADNGDGGIKAVVLDMQGNGAVSIELNQGGAGLQLFSLYLGHQITDNDSFSVVGNAREGIRVGHDDTSDAELEGAHPSLEISHHEDVSITNNGSAGIKIDGDSTLTFSDNASVLISMNGSMGGNMGIESQGLVSLSGNGSVEISGNYNDGLRAGEVQIADNGTVCITDNVFAGLEIGETATISHNELLDISGNYQGIGVGSLLELSDNGQVNISGNDTHGILAGETLMAGNGKVMVGHNGGAGIFSDFLMIGGNETILVESNQGGGIAGDTAVISGNASVLVRENGGGIAVSSLLLEQNDWMEITGNGGDGIAANTLNMTGNGTIRIENQPDGDAIRVSQGEISQNGDILISYFQTGINNSGDFTISDNGDIFTIGGLQHGIANSGVLDITGNQDIISSGNGGSGFMNQGTLTLRDNGNIYMNGNQGAAIDNNGGTLVLDGNTSLNIVNSAGAAISGGDVTIEAHGNIALLDNEHGFETENLTIVHNGDITIGSSAHGGNAFHVSSYGSIENNGQISIYGMGYGVYQQGSSDSYSELEVKGNREISIHDNGWVGILVKYGIASIRDNGNISIVDNYYIHQADNFTVTGGNGIQLLSGAIDIVNNGDINLSGNNTGIRNIYENYQEEDGVIKMQNNGNVIFADNHYYGINNERTIDIINNKNITFFRNNYGAINNYGNMTISGNENIDINENFSFNGGRSGGIRNWGNLTISDNANVNICDNEVFCSSNESSAGIYIDSGNTVITNNKSVVFQRNLKKSESGYELNAIYARSLGEGFGSVTLAAPEQGNIVFYENVQLYNYQNTLVDEIFLHLNGVQDEGSGAYAATGGVIRLTGESTEADLLAAYERAGLDIPVTQAAITASRTSITNGHTALHGGELQIVHHAALETNGFLAEGAGNATLRLEDGALRSTAAVTMESGTILALSGQNTLTATTLDLQDGATLDFTIASGNDTDAVLTLDGQLNIGELLIRINYSDGLDMEAGIYKSKLLTLSDASQFDLDTWTADQIKVAGSSFSWLQWEDGTLYCERHVYQPEIGITWGGNGNMLYTYNDMGEISYLTDGPCDGVVLSNNTLIITDGIDDELGFSISYDNTTKDAERLTLVERSASFVYLSIGDAEGSSNMLEVADGQTASTAALNGAGDLAKTGSGTLEITGAGDHSGTLAVQQGSVSLTGDGQLSSGTIILGSDASAFSLRRATARSADAPIITTDSGITLTQNDSSRTGSLSGHEPLSAQGTAIIGQAGQRAVADNVCITLDNAQATFTLGNLDLNNTVVDVNATAGLILHDLRMDATSQVANRTDVLAQMTGQNSLQLGGLVSITSTGQMSTEQLYGVELSSTGSLTMSLDSDLLAAAGLTEGGVAELWLSGLQVADTATLSFEDVLQADGLKLAITIQAIERATDGTRLQIAVAAVPEPATATLTLLALTALAARRKRGLRPDPSLRPAC